MIEGLRSLRGPDLQLHAYGCPLAPTEHPRQHYKVTS